MQDQPDPSAELLARMRATLGPKSIVFMVVIDEYQLRFQTTAFAVISDTEWVLTSPDGRVERLNADHRERPADAYSICRIIGHGIISVDFDASGGLVLGLDTGETLTMPKRDTGHESFVVAMSGTPEYSGSGLYLF